MRVHWIQHVPFEGLGRIEEWIRSNGHSAHRCRIFEGDPLPAAAAVDLLIVMGGPMSVNQEDQFPWLREEKRRIRDVIELGTPVLGICLGAQLIASAMGEKVYPAPAAEVGWLPVKVNEEQKSDVFRCVDELIVFQWHGETFDLPAGAVLLASSEACKNQMFLLGKNVIGMQFHLETTPESAELLIENCPEDLAGGGRYVQSAATIAGRTPQRAIAAEKYLLQILDYLAPEAEKGD